MYERFSIRKVLVSDFNTFVCAYRLLFFAFDGICLVFGGVK